MPASPTQVFHVGWCICLTHNSPPVPPPNHSASVPSLICKYNDLVVSRPSEVIPHLQHTPLSGPPSSSSPWFLPYQSLVPAPGSAWVPKPNLLVRGTCAGWGLYPSTHPRYKSNKVLQTQPLVHRASTLNWCSPISKSHLIWDQALGEIPRLVLSAWEWAPKSA